MKKIAIGLVLLLASIEVSLAQQTAREWVRFTSAEGRYSVLLPAQPEVGTQESATADGVKFTQHKAMLVNGNAVYLIGYFDHVPGTTFSYNRARDGMIAAVKGTLINEQPASGAGTTGTELRIATKTESGLELLLIARIYDVNTRVYVLQYIIPKAEDGSAATANTTKFFDSFLLKTSS